VLELVQRCGSNEAAKHHRQKPGARILWPLQEDRGGDNEKRQRVEREELFDRAADSGRQPGVAGQPGPLERGRCQHQGKGSAVALDLQRRDIARARVTSKIEPRLVAVDGRAIDRDDAIALLHAGFGGRTLWKDTLDIQPGRRGPIARLEPQRRRWWLPNEADPGEAVRCENDAVEQRQTTSGHHEPSLPFPIAPPAQATYKDRRHQSPAGLRDLARIQ